MNEILQSKMSKCALDTEHNVLIDTTPWKGKSDRLSLELIQFGFNNYRMVYPKIKCDAISS